ncbi:ROK family protein [Paenibacillus sp. H1-7]|uniref:ROK family protein n=1 Tax=Paenibacillus sp. H1-7 TaxID=2282849 RepID=UPI001EF76AD5|nr:ROK family protein [Paenibacillus sp. H1-7]ULL16904.1 ROK family protein [Paenibacillus sp. H1-7]
MSWLAGIDIGGTKCAVCLGEIEGSGIRISARRSFPTDNGNTTPYSVIRRLIATLDELLLEQGSPRLLAIGISCGGPLDSRQGLILSPPNLPGWNGVDMVRPLREHYGIAVGLQNDANACALAEWKWGAGRGSHNMVFLTFGTGMGAGLILNGALYSGTNDMAGEIGHMRLEASGPDGYGKAGSFEGYCSGGGIAKLARSMALEELRKGESPLFCPKAGMLDAITAKKVGEAAAQGDPLALKVWGIVGKQLGRGLAVLVDLLNPELIVIGSIYGRQQPLLEPLVMQELQREALPYSMSVCRIVPAQLSEQIGDYASLSVASRLLPS